MIISFICESFLFQISLIELDNLMFLLFSMPFFLNCIKHTYFIFVSKVSMSGFCTDFSQHLIVSINAHSCFLVCLMNFDQGFIFLGKLSRGLFFEDWVETMFIQRDLHCLLGTWEQHYQPGTVLNQISSQSILHHRGSLQSDAMTTSWLVFLMGAFSASFVHRAGLWEGTSNPVAPAFTHLPRLTWQTPETGWLKQRKFFSHSSGG